MWMFAELLTLTASLMFVEGTPCTKGFSGTPESKENFPDHCITYIDLVVAPLTVNRTSYNRWGIEGNGPQWRKRNNVGYISVPEGEDINIAYRNFLSNETLIHAHGLTPPSNLDGVPYISAVPLKPNRTQLYSYRLRPQNVGTYFIHSHYSFHHEMGLAAPLIVHGKLPSDYPHASSYDKAKTTILYLEDFCAWASDAGEQQNLKCLDSVSVYKTLEEGWNDEKDTWNFTECMAPGTDSDVNYRYQLANYRTLANPVNVFVTAGELIRLRVVASSGMTNYFLDLGKLQGTLIMTDGQLCHPYTNTTFWVGVAQRLDIIITIPSNAMAQQVFPIFAYVEKVDMRTGILLVVGNQQTTKKFLSKSGKIVGFMSDDIFKVYAENKIMAWFPILEKETDRNFIVNLTGDNGFSGLNEVSYQLPPQGPANPFISNPNPLMVKAGERACIKFINFNADAHAMHLHGHSFHVIEMNGFKLKNGPMRDVVMSPKGKCHSVSICFNANNPGIWPLHCHMNYHLAAGMLTTLEYSLEKASKRDFGKNCTAPDLISTDSSDLIDVPKWSIAVTVGIGIMLFFIGLCVGRCYFRNREEESSLNKDFQKL